MIELEKGDEVVCSGHRAENGAHGVTAATLLVTKRGLVFELIYDLKTKKYKVTKVEL